MMRSRLIVLMILLLVLFGAGQVFAATYTQLPSQVPKGAYVNGPGGATDDNYYWQAIKVTFGDTHAAASPFLTITLPTDMTVADTDGDTSYNDEVSISYNTTNDPVFVVAAGTNQNQVVLNVTSGGGQNVVANDYVWVMFPVETASSPSVSSAGYAFTYANPTATDPDVTASNGPQITYRDPGALQLVNFESNLSADDDTTSTYGEMYPSTLAAMFGALPDFVKDTGEAQTFGNEVTASDANDTNDITYTLWIAADSTLSHVDELTSGVLHVIDYDNGGNYTVNEAATGAAARMSTAGLAEGNYYVYITSSLTGDFPLCRSGRLTVLHYPEVKILGWDYTGDGTFDNSGGDADDFSLTVDTGSYYRYDGTLAGSDTRTDVDLYINVDDFDDNARVLLFYSTDSGLTLNDLYTSGTAPNVVVDSLSNATVLVDTLWENQEDVEGFIKWNWDLTPSGTSYVSAATYYIYAVANDGKHQSILISKGTDSSDTENIAVKHSPDLTIDSLSEYDTAATAGDITIDPSQTDVIMLSWGKSGINGDSDIDDSCVIEFYIDYDDATDGNADYGSNDASSLRSDASTTGTSPTGTHQIFSGMLEDLESKDQSYYAWNLKEDFQSTGWYPNDESVGNAQYHLYAIIDENKTGGTARVVALGDDGLLNAGEDITDIDFDNNPFVRAFDPPAEGVTVNGDETYRIRFEAFDFDANGQVGVFIVEASTTVGGAIGPATATVTQLINATNVTNGVAYCLTDDDGNHQGGTHYWLNENSDTYYDLTVRLPSESDLRYTTDVGTHVVDMAEGTYWVYIGVDPDNNDFGDGSETLYRAPGPLTLKNISDTDDASQRNAILTPTNFNAAEGDTITFSVRAADEGKDVDLMDFYIAVEKDAFSLVSQSAPFSDSVPNGALIANEAIDDTTNNRWILHATAYNDGNAINPSDTDLGSVIATLQLVSNGTTNAIGEDTGVYFVNEPANGWVTEFSNDGAKIAIDAFGSDVTLVPRGIVEGIVEFQGREHSNYTVNFELRKRGSYVSTADTAFINRNDADSNTDGLQYTLDNDGKFTLSQVPSGEWDLVVQYNRYLSKLKQISVYPGLDTLFVSFGELKGGDCVGYTDSSGAAWPDNQLDSNDINRIKDAYLDTPDSSRWDDGQYNYKWADIDESGKVDVADLKMATENLAAGESGAQPVYKPAVRPAASNLNALVELLNVPDKFTAGETYSVQVVVRNAEDVTAYFVNLDYDSDMFAFEGITEGNIFDARSETFPTIGANTVGLTNAPYESVSFSGDGVLAEVSFRALKDGSFTPDVLGIREATFVNSSFMKENVVMNDQTTVVGNDAPATFELKQNFPNPFNPTTTIGFSVPDNGHVRLKIYDILGRHVRTLVDGTYPAGNYNVMWDATDQNGNAVSAGVYFYTIQAGNHHATKRMLLLK